MRYVWMTATALALLAGGTAWAQGDQRASEPDRRASGGAMTPMEPGDPRPTPVGGKSATATPSGLRYWVLRSGSGDTPKPDAQVVVHYSGWLSNGSLYTTTAKQEGPSTVRLGYSIIPGLSEGIATMRRGGKRKFEIPPNLAYGERGFTGRVPPNETLTFEVELVDIHQPPMPPPTDKLKSTTTGSGLTYWDVREGTGETPGPDDAVTIKFSRWRENGRLIDTTAFDDKPATFLLSQVTEGWSEGIRTMRVGGIRALRIPPELAFGDRGLPPVVGPGEVILSEIELLETRTIKKVHRSEATVKPIKTKLP